MKEEGQGSGRQQENSSKGPQGQGKSLCLFQLQCCSTQQRKVSSSKGKWTLLLGSFMTLSKSEVKRENVLEN